MPSGGTPLPTTSSRRPPDGTAGDVVAAAGQVLHENWRSGHRRDGVPYAFTCPAVPRYRHQWYWDSCFHAIAWRHFDPARARAELRTLLRAGRPNGFVPHTAFWDAPAYWRRAPLYATGAMRGSLHTESIGPPLLAWAWALVAEASRDDDPDFFASGREALERHYDWLDRERDIDRDGLITILLPDESGLDDAPKYDPVFRWMTHDRPGYFHAVARARRLGYQAGRIAARYEEHVEDVLVNVLYARGLQALGGRFAERAERVERALLERSWDPGAGLFWDLAGRDERPATVSTWSSLAPLALPGIPDDVKRELVERHLLHPRRYRAATGIPSVAMTEATFNPHWDRFRCWRGPAWMVTAWLLVPPLRQLGYEDEADRIVASLVEAVRRHGLREYYNPLTGGGLGARRFGMSALIVELVLG